jgi:hypothetical protein
MDTNELHSLDIPPDQMPTAVAITRAIGRQHNIDPATAIPMLTYAAFPCDIIIESPNLDFLPPELRYLLPASLWLEDLLSSYSSVIIITHWKVDLYQAMHGDREAASRRAVPLVERLDQQIPLSHFKEKAKQLQTRPDQARLELLTDALLEVICHRNEFLPLRSVSDSSLLKNPDGTIEIFYPNALDFYTFWRWVEVEAVRAATSMQYGHPYMPAILLEATPTARTPPGYGCTLHLSTLPCPGGVEVDHEGLIDSRMKRQYFAGLAPM